MRIVLIQVMQETCSFNPSLTTLADFETFGIHRGAEVVERSDGAGPIAGYLDGVSRCGVAVETLPIVRGTAQSGGRLERAVLDEFDEIIRGGLADGGRLDGIVMLLHGAASAVGVDDVDGHLLGTVREVVGAAMPIAVMLDHHANVTEAMIQRADLIVGFRTQPHDQFETARDLTLHAIDLFQGKIRPTIGFRKLRMLTHQEQFLTSSGPMKRLFDRAREMEQLDGVIAVSPFPMQCWLDAEEAGWSVVVVTDHDHELAGTLADELADLAWSMRDDFQVTESVPVGEAVRAAAARSSGTVLLSDTGDSVLGGSGGDSTVILEALLREAPDVPALVPVIDAHASRVLAAAGVGARVTLELGGRSTPLFHPLEVEGTVRAVGDGIVSLRGLPQGRVEMGHTIAFEIRGVTVLVTEHAGAAGIHPDVYRHVGLEPSHARIIVMKTASNFQYMRPITQEFVRVATPGPTQSDLASLPWTRTPRPIFPLDPTPTWRA